MIAQPQLLGLSQKCLDDLLPQLDVGDSLGHLSGKASESEEDKVKRDELVEVLSGRTVIIDEEAGFAPWSLCYGGHQFGVWASQLGDGRANSILVTPSPQQSPPLAEIQLKGAGRTPYSRFADGLAVLRSSVREYLGAEAVAALQIPTSRALSLVGLRDCKVERERLETAAIVGRIAPSWVRIGNFEIQRTRQQWALLAQLVKHVGVDLFGFDALQGHLTHKMVSEISRRNALMIASWQAYGFMHGVMNTDNISVLGLTIDYGPYAIMDTFSASHICNHSDDMGRYAYRMQPTMGVFAVKKLGEAVAELLGYEDSRGEAAIESDWEGSEEGLQERMASYRKKGLEMMIEIEKDFTKVFMDEYKRLMALRLGLEEQQENDFQLYDKLLNLMEEYSVDFHRTFRILCQFESVESSNIDAFIEHLVPEANVSKYLKGSITTAWKEWLKEYESRLSTAKYPADHHKSRRERMQAVNPRFVLRQWVLEETITRLDKDENPDIKFLDLVMRMAVNPFESYGETQIGQCEVPSETEDAKEMKRLCEVGPESYKGFQCSCSS